MPNLDRTPPPASFTPLLALVFGISGAAALIFEALWFHQAGLALGNSVWAAAVVLAAFMGGLALGNLAVGHWGHRLARPLLAYAGLEVAIGLAGLALVLALPAVTPWLAAGLRPLLDAPWLLNSLRLAIAFGLLLAPAVAMGATLPLVTSALYRRDACFGRALGRLYGWNTLGAVAGVLAAEMLLLPGLGVRGSALAAAGLDLAAAGGALLLARRGGAAALPPPRPGLPMRRHGWLLLAAAFLAGATLLALEVVWLRFMQLFVLGTGLAFAVMLAVILAGIGLGGLLGGAWVARRPGAPRGLPLLAAGAGVGVVACYAGLAPLLAVGDGRALQGAAAVAALTLPLMLPVSLLSGVLFTLMGSALEQATGSESRAAGYLTFANTTGAMLGSAAAGLLLLPALGMEGCLRLAAAAYLALALLLAGAGPGCRPRSRRLTALAALTVAAAVALFPAGLMQQRYLRYPTELFRREEGAETVAVREGLTETVMLMRVERFGAPLYHRLVTNAYSMSATTYPSQRYMSLFAHLPAMLHAGPRQALLISYGVGVTAGALTDLDSLERIDIVDISRDILETSRLITEAEGLPSPLDDPRVRVHVEDGRFFLQTTPDRYDLITGEPPPPRMAGVASLYTREYFRIMRERLRPAGLASYWLPVHSLSGDEARAIVAAFCDAFSDCSLWSGAGWDWLLLGSRPGADGGRPAARPARLWQSPALAARLQALAVERPEQVVGLLMADAATLAGWTAGVAPLDDDHPRRLGPRDPSTAEIRRQFRPWADAAAAARRFAAAPDTVASWPAGLVRSAAAAFANQKALNALMFGEANSLPATLPEVHRLLGESDLQTLPLLLLGTDPPVLKAAAAAAAAGREDAGIAARLGLAALAGRRPGVAAERLAAAFTAGDRRPSVAWALAYALCLDGRLDEAARFMAGSGLAAAGDADSRQALGFLAATFPGLSSAGSTAGR